jgi:hypothetical protein
MHVTDHSLPATSYVALLALALMGFDVPASQDLEPSSLCRIEVVEKGTGWPVPLVELRTTHQVRFVTDNAGIIAFDLPELMGRETWFDVIGHGYEMPKDGFGMRGVRMTPEPGKTIRVEIQRAMIARRLGRITGAGLFAESQKFRLTHDWPESGVLGCDSVQNAVHRGQLFWLWGDTTLARYPLGIFDTSSATTIPRFLESFEPPLRVTFDYFTHSNGSARGVAPMPGDGPTWLSGCVSLPDSQRIPHLVASYAKIRGHLEPYRVGLCAWNEDSRKFESVRIIWTQTDVSPKPPRLPEGHASFWKDEQGKEWVLFGDPLPKLRCPASFEAWQDPSMWETLTPQPTLLSATDGKPVKPHSGSIAWSPWHRKWVTVFVESSGKPSSLGEVWYAEAAVPTGPWGKAVKVLTHDNYTFYNPRVHSELLNSNSPVLCFEGTYTRQFAGHPLPTPRYDYNQILYRLDLNDPALRPAQSAKP